MQVVVLGMHRSGTSALTRVLDLMGCHLGDGNAAFHGPDPNNPAGYWERKDVWGVDEALLSSLGGSWHDVAHLDLQALAAETRSRLASEARAVVTRLDEHRPWAIKDPRLCILLPFWRAFLTKPICILIHRSPLEVARSIQTRDGFPIPFGIALWETYNLDALRNSASLTRLVVSYEELLAQPAKTVRRLLKELTAAGVTGLHAPKESALRGFLDPKLHRERGDARLEGACLLPAQRKLLLALRTGAALRWDPVPVPSPAGRDEVVSFNSRLKEIGKIRSDEEAARKAEEAHHARDLQVLNGMLDEKDRYIADLQKQRGAAEAAHEKTIQTLEPLVLQKDRDLSGLQVRIAGLEASLTERAAAHAKGVESLEQMVAEKDRYIADLLALEETAKAFFKKAAAALQAVAAEKERALAAAVERLAKSELDKKSLRRALRDKARELRAARTLANEPIPPASPAVPTVFGDLAVCTIVSKNYISMARVCCESFLAQHRGARAFVLIVDHIDGSFDPGAEIFETIEVEDLNIAAFSDFAYKYNILELNTAVKPYFLQYLFEKRGVEKLFYLDPDIFVYGPLADGYRELDANDILLTPHILSAIGEDGRRPNENDLLVAGVFNLGFLGLKKSTSTLSMLTWWQTRLYDSCFSDPGRGLFTDQKWMNLAPGLFPSVGILRHAGYNVAYWNLHERRDLEETTHGYVVNGVPLVFFHFSGFEKETPNRVSKHQDRFRLPDLNRHYRKLFLDYSKALSEHGWEATRSLPYAFGFFDNGAVITNFMRRVYWTFREGRARFGNPFETATDGSFFSWLTAPHRSGSSLSNLLVYMYQQRADVAAAFPDPEGAHTLAYLEWAQGHSAVDFGLSDIYQEGFRRLLAEAQERAKPPEPEPVPPPAATASPEPPPQTEPVPEPAAALPDVEEDEPKTEWKKSVQSLLGVSRYRALRRRVWRLYSAAHRFEAACRAWRDPARPEAPLPVLAEAPAPARPFGVNLFGYFDTENGIGEVARSFAAMLREADVPNALINVEQQWLRRGDQTILQFSSEHPFAVNLAIVNADQAPALRERLGPARSNGHYNIGYWFWELSTFPERYAGSFPLFDEIWVASDFCLDAVSRAGSVPTVKMTPAMEPKPPGARTRPDFSFEPGEFVFLYIFDSLSVVRRKNPGGVISAFRRAFSPGEPVRLVLKTMNASSRQMHILERHSRDARVHVWNEYLRRGELLDLVAAADAYVSLHRSEGLGLTPLEALLLGKPVIATNYSGVREFLEGPSAYPVGYKEVALTRDFGAYPKGSVWAEPNVCEAARHMRTVFEAARNGTATPPPEELRRRYSVKHAAVALKRRLGRIESELVSRGND